MLNYKYFLVINFLISMTLSMPILQETSDMCSEPISLFWKFTWKYMKDRNGLLFLSVEDDSMKLSKQILECAMLNYVQPIEILSRDRNFVPVIAEQKVFRARNRQGLIITSNEAKTLMKKLNTLYQIDPNTITVLILTNGTSQDVENLLRTAWHRYKILNIIIFLLQENSPQNSNKVIPKTISELNILKNQLSEMELFFYNPFLISNNARGQIYKFRMKNNDQMMHQILSLINERLLNVYQYPLKICIFKKEGSAAPIANENGTIMKYGLKNGEIIDALVKTVNFKPVYYSPLDGHLYGNTLANGSQIGALKEIEIKRAEILGNLMIIAEYGQKESVFLFPADESNLAFLVPKITTTREISFFRVFNMDASILLAVTFMSMNILWYLLQEKYYSIIKVDHIKMEFIDISHSLLGSMIMVSQRSFNLRYERILFASWVIFSMINCITYQAKMVEHLAALESEDINTFKDLAKSGLKLVTVPEFRYVLKDISNGEQDPETFRALYKMQETDNDMARILKKVGVDRTTAFMYNSHKLDLYRMGLYSNETGEDLAHIMEDALPMRFSSNMVPQDSPYMDRFNKILMRIRESGLVTKWKNDELYERKISDSKRPQSKHEVRVFEMKELTSIFVAFLVCCFISCVVFVLELVF